MRYFNIGTDTIQGGRDYQDDYLETDEFEDGSVLLLLADGMGGYAGGRIASETVIRAFKSTFNYKSKDIKEELLRSLKVANDALAQKKEVEDKKYEQMGTTLIVVYATPSYIQWVSVGDSPLLLIRDGEIRRINKNHSIAGLLELQYKHGEITKEEMENAPNKHVLTSAIVGEELMSVDLSEKLELKSNDIIILTSDGVETLSFEEIKEIALNTPTIAETTQNILKAVIQKDKPNQDNTTVIAIQPKQVKKEKGLLKTKIALLLVIIIIGITTYFKITKKTPHKDSNSSQEIVDDNKSKNLKIPKAEKIVVNTKEDNNTKTIDKNSSKEEKIKKVTRKKTVIKSTTKDTNSSIKSVDINSSKQTQKNTNSKSKETNIFSDIVKKKV